MIKEKSYFTTALFMLAFIGCVTQGDAPAIEGRAISDSTLTAIDPYQPRFDRERPLVAVLGHSGGSEITDFVVPYGVLAASGKVDLVTVSTAPGPIQMFPALTIEADATIEEFDERYPEGADYIIVPAVHDAEDPVMLDWIRKQEERNATIVGVCDGVLILANSGVLEGRRATAHWYSFRGLEKGHPGTEWVRNQRYVADGNVITTTGVSASIPISLALVEAIAGYAEAAELAASLGIDDWSPMHDSQSFGLSARHVLTAARNKVAFWRHEAVGIELEPGIDEITLALNADLWSRTFRSHVYSYGGSGEPVRTRNGLRVIPDHPHSESEGLDRWLEPLNPALAGSAIDMALDEIAEAYDSATAAFVALQIEYPWRADM